MKTTRYLLLAALAVLACNKPGEEPDKPGPSDKPADLSVDFTIDREKAFTGDEVSFTAVVSGGTAPYTYAWSFNDESTSSEANPKVTFTTTGVKVISLNVTDAAGNKPARPKAKTFLVEEKPIEDKGDIAVAWYALFGDKGGGVRGAAPAVDDAGNIYLAGSVKDNGKLYKVSPEGKVLASVAIGGTGNYCLSAGIDKAGSILGGGASGGGAVMAKYDSGLTKLWSAEFWGNGKDPNPKLWYGYAVQVSDAALLVANAGTTGTMGAISAADGKRLTWLVNSENGAISGGCRQAPAVSKDGFAWQACAANGVVGAEVSGLLTGSGAVVNTFNLVKNLIDAGGNQFTLTCSGSDRPQMAVVTVDGTSYGAGLCSPEGDPATVYLIDKTGAGKGFLINDTNTSIANTTAQDQGGVVIGPANEVIVNLKSGADASGGIVAVNPKTMTLAWEYRLAESVSGTPAVTAEGLVVFGTDKGSFCIIKPDAATKGAELVAKADITALVKEAGMPFDAAFESPNIKMWSGVTIGDDGKMYVGFQKVDMETESGASSVDHSWPQTGGKNGDRPAFLSGKLQECYRNQFRRETTVQTSDGGRFRCGFHHTVNLPHGPVPPLRAGGDADLLRRDSGVP